MRSRRRLTLATVVALMMLTAVGMPLARGQVLDSVPADALVVLKVNNLKATSDKLAKFFTDLGFAQMVPQLADPLGALEQHLKISAGLDRTGEMAFAFIDPTKTGVDEDQSMVILIPVTDYQAFLGNFPDAAADGDVSQVKLGDSPDPGYVANWGKYAAVSPAKEVVATKPSAGLKLSAATSKQAQSKDILLYANMATIREKLVPELNKNRENILAEVESGVKENEQTAKYAPVLRSVVNQVLNAAEAFLRDSDGATVGISLTGEGIAFTTLADFQSDSYLGQFASSIKNTDELMLSGLATGDYLVFAGSKNDPAVTNKLIDDFTKPILDELNKLGGAEAEAITRYVAAIKQQVGAIKGQSVAMVAPTGNLGQEPIFQLVNVMSGDVETIRASYVEMMKTQESMMRALGQPEGMVKTTHTPNAKTIDGVAFDQVVSKFDMATAGPEAAQAEMMMNYMYGPDGVNVLIGTVNDRVIVSMGAPESVISATIAAVKANSAPLAENAQVKSVAAQLPQQRNAIVFIAVDKWVSTGLTYAKQFGFAVPVQLPPDLPPVGASIATEGSAIRIDGYVPSSLVQSLVAAGMQAYMQMQGAGGPGKGGGL